MWRFAVFMRILACAWPACHCQVEPSKDEETSSPKPPLMAKGQIGLRNPETWLALVSGPAGTSLVVSCLALSMWRILSGGTTLQAGWSPKRRLNRENPYPDPSRLFKNGVVCLELNQLLAFDDFRNR
ncbi:hypothetical protein MN608_02257 [Microdochium nivale]|nr:hypothetical protein MN608_02257 [Microdochium nivale]